MREAPAGSGLTAGGTCDCRTASSKGPLKISSVFWRPGLPVTATDSSDVAPGS
jgi:hypothetical protein